MHDVSEDRDTTHANDVIVRARRVADNVLFPTAQEVDRTTIPSTHLDALRSAGLFSFGDVSPGIVRRAMAAIAGGCGATFFVWVQHHGVVRDVASSSNAALGEALMPSLLDGSIVAGTAFAHVRRTGSPAVRATRVEGGWRLDGEAPWATSWGIADRFTVAAVTDRGQIVWPVLPSDGGPGVTAVPLELPVFSATGTVAIRFDGALVGDAHILTVQDADAWRGADRLKSSVGAPAVLGVADRAIRLLRDAARDEHDRAGPAAQRLQGELDDRWKTDDELTERLGLGAYTTDDQGVEELVAAASAHRAACLDLGHRATTAFLAAVGGRGMDLGHPAQRLTREAAFYVIQAQTRDARAAALDAV